jgi:2-polyprenyl-3-methyl-5-hydroxy-6-metoxy-1,4-benzoquinol methylase/glycosyltransferase involved in cell wall biosynthesis
MSTARRVDILNFNFFDWSGERLFTGGAERYVYDLALLCRKLGLRPRFIQNGNVAFERTFSGIDVLGVPAAKSMDFPAMSRAFAELTRDAALIIASPLELACRLNLSPPVIGINHGIHWDSPSNRRSTFSLARFSSIFEALDVVTRCVCVDTNFGNWLQSIDGRTLPLLEYIPNYVDTQHFHPEKKRFDQKRLNVLFPRRLCEERGFRDVLEAFDSLLTRHPEIALHLCGSGLPVDEQLARDFLARHPGRVHWSELPMEEMPQAYAESHVVLVPSTYSEGASLACIEAMACNNAVIASTVGGLPNLIIDGYNGLLIRPGVRSLTVALERLVADRSLVATLARNALGVSAALSRAQWETRWSDVLSTCLPMELKAAPPTAGDAATKATTRRAGARAATRDRFAPAPGSDDEPTRRARHWMHEALRKHDRAALEHSQLAADRDSIAALHAAAVAAHAAATIEHDQALAQLAAADVERGRLDAALGIALLERDAASAARATLTTERDAAQRERDHALAERDAETVAREAALAERADALATRDVAAAERDVAMTKRDVAMTERDAALAQRDRSLGERDAADVSRQQMTLERDRAALERDSVRQELDAAQAELATLNESLRATQEAKNWVEQQHYWASSELKSIKTSTGWHLLQVLYKIRFALFPRGSRREALAKRTMHAQRQWRRVWRQRPRAPRLAPSTTETPVPDPGTQADPPQVPLASRPLPAAAPYAVVCLPLIEWRFRFQRPQQLARRFARKQHPVYFARLTFGASLDATHLEPGVEGLELPGPADLNPYQSPLETALAERMADALLAHLKQRQTEHFVCIVQLPFWTPLAQILQRRSGCDIVYDCMDHHAGFSTNAPQMVAEEERLLARADLVVTSSRALHEQVAPRARSVALVRNAADYEHFASTATSEHNPVERLLIGYYGAIADWFDSDLVAAIARLRPGWRFVLVGSTFSADTEPLTACANIELTGEKPYAELPQIIAPWDCCIIPFQRIPLTEATNPVKVYEMLAAAKPIVAVGLPELEPIATQGLLAIAEGHQDFVAAIERMVVGDMPARQAARRAYAAQNDWAARQQQFDAAIAAIRPLVSVIIVTYNNLGFNRQCLASVLEDTDYPAIEVIVVDNASADGTPAFLRELAAREPRLRIVLNTDNRGFSAANNQGAELARGRYLCFLNNDTIVHGAWLSTLIGHLRRHPSLGLVGPVTNAIGNAAKIPVGYNTPADMPAWADLYCAAHVGELHEISMLAFFCVALPRHVWDRVGNLDERFGAGMFEDDDYNRRVRAAGFEVRLALDSFVHHWQKASFNLLGGEEYLRIYRENETLYHAKWEPSATQELPSDELTPLRQHAKLSKGMVIFAPSVGWDIDLAQRPHHLARALARDGYTVVFDCSNDVNDFKSLKEVERGLFLYSGEAAKLTALPNALLWTFTYNYDFRNHFPPATPVVYDWIDDLSVFPYDQASLSANHERALREATLVTCVARRLHDEAVQTRTDAIYLPNAVEAGRFDREPQPNMARSDVALRTVLESGKPIAGYYGAFAEWFDYDLLLRTAELQPDWSFVLIGPDLDGSLGRAALDRLPNICWLGPRDYLLLPGYLHLFDVATIPFQINSITTATSPLKLYEYFAAGKPVVSTPMPECMTFAEVHIAATAETFAAALDSARASAKGRDVRQRLVALAAQNTWSARARTVLRALHACGSLGSGPSAMGQRTTMQRFHDRETPTNRQFFRALAAHLGPLGDDPALSEIFTYAITANDRGRDEVRKLAALTPLAGKRTLDVDCTYGGLLVALAELGAHPEGIDPNPGLLKLARHNIRDAGYDFPLYELDLAGTGDARLAHRYDVITCNAFLERAQDAAMAIRRIASMLKEDGIAVYDLPNRDAVARVLAAGPRRLFGLAPLDGKDLPALDAAGPLDADPTLRYFPSFEEYEAMFAASGFDMALVSDASGEDMQSAADEGLAALRQSLSDRLRELPESMRSRAKTLVKQYLAKVDVASRRGFEAGRAFGARYQSRYLRVVALPRPDAHRTATTLAHPTDLSVATTPAVSAEGDLTLVQQALMARFRHLETPANRNFFRALCTHLADGANNPSLPMYFGFAISANDRGRAAADIIERLVPLAGKRALDIGCAYGGFLVALAERGAEPIGVDTDPQLLRLGEHNFRDTGLSLPTYCKDVTKSEDIAPFLDRFDIITCNDVIEHVTSPAATIRHVAAMLREDGLAYFEIPNRDAWASVASDGHYQLFGITQLNRDDARAYFAAHAPGVPYGVEHYLSLGQYQALFEAAGLEPSLLNAAGDGGSVADTEAGLAELRASLADRLESVPRAVRDVTRAAVEHYLAEAAAIPRTNEEEQRAFLSRYATGFWRIAVRKSTRRATSAQPNKHAGSQPAVVSAAPALQSLPAALLGRRFVEGRCNVCGNLTRFFYTAPALYREELTCEHCRTTSRYRSIARGLLAAIAQRAGVEASALAELPARGVKQRLRLYDTQPPFYFEPCAYPLPELLRRCDWIDLTLSCFKPDITPGAALGEGVTNQNLEALTFADSSFDIVVTSDVMEHVRLDDRAHREIARVLKPGGHYLFTVPHFRDRHDTLVRVRVADPEDRSRDEYLTEPEYHGDANAGGTAGVLSYRSYGTVLDDELSALGFDVSYTKADFPDVGILNTELFHCSKR